MKVKLSRDKLKSALREDPEFRVFARYWSGSLRFDIGDDGVLRTLVTAAFSHRRKTLRNGLKSLLTGSDIEACGIDPNLRPETLAPAQFGLLAAHYCRLRGNSLRQSA